MKLCPSLDKARKSDASTFQLYYSYSGESSGKNGNEMDTGGI